jgi:hypothetical protein
MNPRPLSRTATRRTVFPIGFVAAIDNSVKQITVRTDTDREILVLFDERTTFQRVAPGAKNLKNAVKILASDVRLGDRLLARGSVLIDGKKFAARSVFVKATKASRLT